MTPPDVLNSTDAAHKSGNSFRKLLIDLLLVAIVGLLVQAFWASRLSAPTYMDAYYYTTNGHRLAEGNGFSEMIIWQFLDDPQGLPTPSHTYWMPFPSMMAAGGYLIQDDFGGAQLLFWLLAGLLPALAYVISHWLTAERWQGWVAAMLVASGGYYVTYMGQPSSFTPFAWAGALTLLAVALASNSTAETQHPGSRFKRRYLWAVAGIAVGLAHLTRADGILLFFIAAAFAIWPMFRRRRQPDLNGWNILRNVGLLLGGYLLIMAPWYTRNIIATGVPLPVAGTQSIFLTSYDDLFAYGRTITSHAFFEWGWGNIIQSRLQAAGLGIQTLVAYPGLIFLWPFMLVSSITLVRGERTRKLLAPFFLYTVILYMSTVVLFAFPGMRGSFFHSSIALFPWTTALAAAGIGISVDWVARRLPHWQPARAKKIFSGLFIGVALIMTLYLAQFRLKSDRDASLYNWIGAQVPKNAVVMVGNAPALYYYTGLAAVSVPNEPVNTLLSAADRYGVNYLVLDTNRPFPLGDLYDGKTKPERLKLVETFEDVQLYEIQPGP